MSEENITVFFMDPENPPPLTAEQKEMLARLDELPDEEIDLSDMPEHHFPPRPPKTDARLRLDGDVVAWLSESRHGADLKANSILRHEMLRVRGRAEVEQRRAAERAVPAAEPVPETAQA